MDIYGLRFFVAKEKTPQTAKVIAVQRHSVKELPTVFGANNAEEIGFNCIKDLIPKYSWLCNGDSLRSAVSIAVLVSEMDMPLETVLEFPMWRPVVVERLLYHLRNTCGQYPYHHAIVRCDKDDEVKAPPAYKIRMGVAP